MNNMMLIRDMYNNSPSFKMIPINNDCPYLEAAFDNEGKQLVLRHRDKIPVFQLFDRLDENGSPMLLTGKKVPDGRSPYKVQRIQFDGNVTYKISHIDDITKFMKRFLVEDDQVYIDMLFPPMTAEQIAEMEHARAKQKEEESIALGNDLQPAELAAVPDAEQE